MGFVATEWRWTRHFDAPYPVIAASSDQGLVARGQYLVYGAAACAYCHVPRSEWATLDRGTMLALTGDHLFRLPFGEIYSSNLTPDPETGIGTRTDAELARVLRYGVRADGRAAFPLMEFQLSDEDIGAVISFLRSRAPVSHAVPEHRLTRFGKALMAFAITPIGPASTAPRSSPAGPSVERGEYLANSVSSCVSCHTDRGPDGALVGPRFGGGQRMDVAADETKVYVTPNLTPDPATSPIGQWPEDTFLARFRMGEHVPGTPMPWGAYARMTDDDLRAVYRYLRSLPPASKWTGPAVQEKTER
jgi:mono/diheme cytochrome c family protein